MAKEKSDTPVFTQSRLACFLECERKEWYAFQCGGMGIGPAVIEDYYIEGELGHYALAQWYTTGRDSKNQKPLMLRANLEKRVKGLINDAGDMLPEQAVELQNKLSAMLGACNGYRQKYITDFQKWEILAVEKVFTIELAGIQFEGRIDLVVRDKSDDSVGFIEHKFLQQFSVDNWITLPLNIQQLIYTMAVESIIDRKPDWYQWNITKKSQLRRKGLNQEGKVPESLLEFEARVQNQYMTEPEKMFFRPPPRKVEPVALDNVKKHVTAHIESWKRIRDTNTLPPMRWPSCTGMYGKGCFYGPACQAESIGHKEGWNAPECQGLYRVKTILHPELRG